MADLSNTSILYLEDSKPDFDYFMGQALKNGINNIINATSLEDLYYLEDSSIKVVLMDAALDNYSFPNGLNIVERIRKKNKDVRIIFITRNTIDSKLINTLRASDISIYTKSELYEGMASALFDEIRRKDANQVFSYKNDLIEELSSRELFSLTEPPKILTDIRLINKSYYDMIKRHPKRMHDLSPRQFEEFTAEMFEKAGYTVTLTQQTRDGGKDLFVLHSTELGDFLYYTECKKYAPDNPVGVRVVRDLLGTITADGATAGIIVTSSYFSPDAIAFALAEQVKHKMTLIDFDKLTKWISKLN